MGRKGGLRFFCKKNTFMWNYPLFMNSTPDHYTAGADPGFVHRGGGDFERSERRAKRVKNSWGYGGRCKPPGKCWDLEPLRVNLSVVWQIISYFLGYFFIKNIWENIFYDFIYTRSGDFLGFASQMKHFSSQIYWHNEGTITVQHTTFSKITTEYN